MTRDMDLVREILLALEAHEHGNAPRGLDIEGYSKEQIGYHVHLMAEAGLVRATDVTADQSPSPQAIPKSLTWEGYEFLEMAREPSRWQAALQVIREKGAALTLEAVKAALVVKVTQALSGQ